MGHLGAFSKHSPLFKYLKLFQNPLLLSEVRDLIFSRDFIKVADVSCYDEHKQ